MWESALSAAMASLNHRLQTSGADPWCHYGVLFCTNHHQTQPLVGDEMYIYEAKLDILAAFALTGLIKRQFTLNQPAEDHADITLANGASCFH